MGYGIRLRCWGEFACFTRPELKVERVTYDVITPSAARGMLEAVYWKPEIRWVIDRLQVLNPIRVTSLRRNEVGRKIPVGPVKKAMQAGRGALGMYVEEERQQRAALVLRDVAYVIGAHFEIVSGDDNAAKHLDMFNRRARAGQCFTRPYLGCREFAAHFALVEADERNPVSHASLAGPIDLGRMLYDMDYQNGREAVFFQAQVIHGIVAVPPLAAVRSSR